MIFVKFPEPGRVKTRIAEAVGAEEAARIYRDLVGRVSGKVVPDERAELQWEVWVIFDPPERESAVRDWLEPLFGDAVERFEPQVEGDLGERLAAAFAAGFAAGFAKVAAIGTDCVELDADGIGECWRLLDEKDVVFGPAEDGGYYLVALKKECAALFAGVPWSSAETLAVSKAVTAQLGLSVGELATLSDVDEIVQWEALCVRDVGHR